MAYQPKSYRKFVATAATATLVASAVTPAFAAETGAAANFTDVSDRYKVAVDYLLEQQITNGYTDTEFGTSMSIKRVDAAIMIAKALDLNLDNRPSSGFTDLPDRAVVYIDALKEEGIINGKTATTFGAEDNITRGEMALIMAKAYGLTGDGSDLPFTDVAPRYQDAVAALVDAGITFGKDADSFGTTDSITRGEFALFTYRAETMNEVVVSGVAVSVDDQAATVTANVANAEAGSKAKVEILANGSTTVAATQDVDVVDGKVSASFAGLPEGTHVAKVTVGEKSSQASFTIAVVKPAVTSVTAKDADTVLVSFSTPLDKDELAESFFTVSGTTVTDAELSEDGRTVELTLGTALANATQYTVTVDKDLQTAKGEDFADKDYVTTILFNDEDAPVVTAVATPNGDLRITFNEDIAFENGNGVVVVNGKSFAINAGNIVDENAVVINKATLTADGTGVKLDSGKSYPIAVANVTDLLGNGMELYSSNFTYQAVTDTTAPTVASVTATGEDTFEVKFSEELSNTPTIQALLNGENVTLVPGDEDGVTFEYSVLPGTDLFEEGNTAQLQLNISGAQDIGSNLMVKTTKNVTLAKDTVRPALKTSHFNADDEIAVLTFTEDIELAGADYSGVTVVNSGTSEVITGLTYNIDGDQLTIDGLPVNGTYTVRVAEGTFTDTSDAANENLAFTTNVTATSLDDEPTVESATASGDVLQVTFSEDVKGGTSSTSAANPANYRLDGQALPAGTFVTLAGDVATITMPEGSITTSRTAILTVSNVETTDGALIDSTNLLVAVTDTKAPELLSAKVEGANLVLTFSEDVDDSTFVDEFNVEVNGTTAGYSIETGDEDDDNVLVLTPGAISFTSGTITVEVDDAATGTDTNGVVIKTGTEVTATR